MVKTHCPVCHSGDTDQILDFGKRPLSVCELQPTAEQSVNLPVHDIIIRVCHRCTHVYNAAFDPEVEQYSKDGCTMYNNGAGWKSHVEDMARWVNSIRKDFIVEVGAGDGEFLNMLKGPKMAFEPSDDADKIEALGIPVKREYFDPYQLLDPGSLVVMRHLLEHIDEPTFFLDAIRTKARQKRYPVELFIEVPCIGQALSDLRIEDWTYEHPNHFTLQSLETLLERTGWKCDSIFQTYGDEVLVAHAKLKNPIRNMEFVKSQFDKLRINIDEFRITDRPYVFWGGAGKSTMFLHTLARETDRVVDSDPRKWGKFVPGLPLRIEEPDIITDQDTVIITTNWRERDILAEIAARQLTPAAVYTFKNGDLHASVI